ncbi:MAG TPA: SDR family oxidoreductase [Pirellulaceae bacterium]
MTSAESGANRVCAITGGSSGIGIATARGFVARGAAVAICGRDAGKLARAEDEILSEAPGARVLRVACDLCVEGAGARFIEHVREAFGRLDVLVNNAGYAHVAPIATLEDAAFQRLMRLNTHAIFETVRAAWPLLKRSTSATIVNVSSLAAVDPLPGFAVYGATKAWVEAFTRALGQEGAADGIVAFAVRPGAVETEMLRGLFPKYPAKQALGPSEVADLICRLSEPEMRACSGAAIPIQRK